MGGKIVGIYLTMGQYDQVALIEATRPSPDSRSSSPHNWSAA
jgi:uncharacterized protein with GYD domain